MSVRASWRVMVNPVSGERIMVRQSGTETDGRLLAFDLLLPPGGHVPAWHTHPEQEEHFTVTRGRFRFLLRHRTVLLGPGESVRVPVGTAHWFGNTGPVEAEARVEVRPALRMEALLEQTADLHAHPSDGLPALAGLLLDYSREVAVPFIPGRLGRTVLRALSALRSRQAGA